MQPINLSDEVANQVYDVQRVLAVNNRPVDVSLDVTIQHLIHVWSTASTDTVNIL